MAKFETLMRMRIQGGGSAVELSRHADKIHFCVTQTDDSEESEFLLPITNDEAVALGEALIEMAGNGEEVAK